MSFLFPSRSDKGDQPANPILVPRILMWIQVVVLGVTVAGTANSMLTMRGLTDEELAEITDGALTGQADVGYTTGWTVTVVLALIAITLAWCALKLGTRNKQIRTMTLATEGLLTVVILVTMAGLCNLLLLVLPALVVLAVLFKEPAKSWFIDPAADQTNGN